MSQCRRQPWPGEHPRLYCTQHHLGDLGLRSAPQITMSPLRLSLLPLHPPCVPQFPQGHPRWWPWSPLGILGELQGPGHPGWEQGTWLSPQGEPRDRFTPTRAACPLPGGGESQGCGHPHGGGDAGQGKPWTTSCSDGMDEDRVSLQHPCGTAHLAPSRAWPGGVKVTQWDRGGVQEPFTAPHARQRPPSLLLPGLPPRLPLTSPRRSQQLFWELQSHWRN